MGPFKSTAHGGYKFVSEITDPFIKWTTVYLPCSKDQALASLQLFVTSTVTPLANASSSDGVPTREASLRATSSRITAQEQA